MTVQWDHATSLTFNYSKILVLLPPCLLYWQQSEWYIGHGALFAKCNLSFEMHFSDVYWMTKPSHSRKKIFTHFPSISALVKMKWVCRCGIHHTHKTELHEPSLACTTKASNRVAQSTQVKTKKGSNIPSQCCPSHVKQHLSTVDCAILRIV